MRTPEEIEAILDKVESLLGEFDEANDRFDRKQWSDKYGERLGQYQDRLKALNGDEFDIMNASFDEKHSDAYKDLEDDQYIDALEDNIKKVIERVWPEASEEVKEEVAETVAEEAKDAAEDGDKVEAHVEAEDKDGDGNITEDEVETHTLEEKDEPAEAAEEDQEDAITSDIRTKRVNKMKGSWKGSPHTSGGRDGTVSDEDAKEEPKGEDKDVADAAVEDALDNEEEEFIKALEEYKESHKM